MPRPAPRPFVLITPLASGQYPAVPSWGALWSPKSYLLPGYTVFHYGSSAQLAKGSIKRVFHFDFSACPISFFISVGISPENMLDPRTREQERAPGIHRTNKAACKRLSRDHHRGSWCLCPKALPPGSTCWAAGAERPEEPELQCI